MLESPDMIIADLKVYATVVEPYGLRQFCTNLLVLGILFQPGSHLVDYNSRAYRFETWVKILKFDIYLTPTFNLVPDDHHLSELGNSLVAKSIFYIINNKFEAYDEEALI